MARYIGDTHGNFEYMAKEFGQGKNVNFKHVGDVGFWYDEKSDSAMYFITKLNNALKKRNNFAYFCRGNHDNPVYWNDPKWSASNLKFVPDYSVLNIEGKMTLFLGGAISVDRKILPTGKYFPDEGFVYDEEKIQRIMTEENQIDVVISHTAPEFCFPFTTSATSIISHYAKHDPTLLKEILQERKLLGDVYRMLNTKFKIKRWVYGHFHMPHNAYYNETEFTLMSANTYSKNQY